MKIITIIALSVIFLTACDQDKTTESENKKTNKAEPTKSLVDNEIESSYSAEVVPEKMTVQEKKKRFRYLIVPAVKQVYKELDEQYNSVKKSINSGTEKEIVAALKLEYKAESDNDLLARLKPHPISIVLAQAAMESAWATSRFFVDAKNIFGVWSFNKNEPRIAAGEKRGSKTIWLKKYKTIEDAVKDNYRVLARGSAFSKFRELRMASSNPFKLVKGLDKYSELGSKYGKELASVIRYNKFDQLDF